MGEADSLPKLQELLTRASEDEETSWLSKVEGGQFPASVSLMELVAERIPRRPPQRIQRRPPQRKPLQKKRPPQRSLLGSQKKPPQKKPPQRKPPSQGPRKENSKSSKGKVLMDASGRDGKGKESKGHGNKMFMVDHEESKGRDDSHHVSGAS